VSVPLTVRVVGRPPATRRSQLATERDWSQRVAAVIEGTGARPSRPLQGPVGVEVAVTLPEADWAAGSAPISHRTGYLAAIADAVVHALTEGGVIYAIEQITSMHSCKRYGDTPSVEIAVYKMSREENK
jgi:Holliday junction resolvase RusA-like endonuclease